MMKHAHTFLRQDQEVFPKPHHYRACGLDDIYLLNGFKIRETAYGRGVAIDDVEGLHQAIAEYLMILPRDLKGSEFRFLRKEMGLTQEQLAQRLRINVQTVARYEKEEASKGIPGPAETLIRAFYLAHVTDGSDEAMELLRMMLKDQHPLQPIRHDPPEGWSSGASAAN